MYLGRLPVKSWDRFSTIVPPEDESRIEVALGSLNILCKSTSLSLSIRTNLVDENCKLVHMMPRSLSLTSLHRPLSDKEVEFSLGYGEFEEEEGHTLDLFPIRWMKIGNFHWYHHHAWRNLCGHTARRELTTEQIITQMVMREVKQYLYKFHHTASAKPL